MTKMTADVCGAKWLGWGVVALSMACSSERAPAKDASQAEEAGEASATSQSAPRNERETTVQLSEDLRRECQLPNAPREAPRFELDKATLRSRGRNILDDVSTCLSEGPLKGRTITIIGRTDPRGTADHNEQLATNRAEAARNYLVEHGVAKDTIRIWSRGEEGAQGKDEETWALDRRVDFELGDRTLSAKDTGDPSTILEGTRMQSLSPGNNPSKTKGGTYSDQSEGGKATGSSGPGTASAK